MIKTLFAVAALAFGSMAAHAQTVYRCGPDGRSYSQTPCAHGRTVEVNDDRSAEQRQDAVQVAERERTLADTLERDRMERESQRPAGAVTIDGRGARSAHARNETPAANAGKTSRQSPHGTPKRSAQKRQDRHPVVRVPKAT